MTIKEKMLKIIALAMSIEATDRYYLTIDWNSRTNSVAIYVHERINGKSQGIVEGYTYDGDDISTSCGSYVTYDDMIDRLKRIKREWENNNE